MDMNQIQNWVLTQSFCSALLLSENFKIPYKESQGLLMKISDPKIHCYLYSVPTATACTLTKTLDPKDFQLDSLCGLVQQGPNYKFQLESSGFAKLVARGLSKNSLYIPYFSGIRGKKQSRRLIGQQKVLEVFRPRKPHRREQQAITEIRDSKICDYYEEVEVQQRPPPAPLLEHDKVSHSIHDMDDIFRVPESPIEISSDEAPPPTRGTPQVNSQKSILRFISK